LTPDLEACKVFRRCLHYLSAQRLSYLIFYHDIFEPPELPETWCAPLSTTYIRGWIALGTYLSQTQVVGAGYGLELIVLDSICDRLYFHRRILHGVPIGFASPKNMTFSILSTTVRRAEQAHIARLPMLVEVQVKPNGMNQLANHLESTPDSQFAAWQVVVLKRVGGCHNSSLVHASRNLRTESHSSLPPRASRCRKKLWTDSSCAVCSRSCSWSDGCF
jgi:hypothetical protein